MSGHLWALYRWPVAVVVTAFAVAGFEAVLGSVGSVVGIAAGVVCLVCLVGTGMVMGALAAHRGGIVAAGLAPSIVAGVLLVEMIPFWRWARARAPRT